MTPSNIFRKVWSKTGITDKLFRIFSYDKTKTAFWGSVLNELSSAQQDTAQDSIQQVADNYRCIIQKITPNFGHITLYPNDLSQIAIDGNCYDLDIRFNHNNRKITECRMAIESMLCDLSAQGVNANSVISKIEAILNNNDPKQEK